MYRKPDGTPDDLAMMQRPYEWVYQIPTLRGLLSILPIKRRKDNGLQCVMVVHFRGTFYLVNKMLGDPVQHEDLTETTTPEALVADGWLVD